MHKGCIPFLKTKNVFNGHYSFVPLRVHNKYIRPQKSVNGGRDYNLRIYIYIYMQPEPIILLYIRTYKVRSGLPKTAATIIWGNEEYNEFLFSKNERNRFTTFK